MTEDYFLSSDELWAETFVADSLVAASPQLANAQLVGSKCKAKVCKVAVNLPKSSGPDSDPMLLEHELLVSLSQKFPTARLKQVARGDAIFVKGCISDASTELPEDFCVLGPCSVFSNM